ncbi:hypothetical protein CYMTET_44944 [Cymbomonas tetramitiformis]|uniref:Uncharacterized protein n=1 Tax=Cymbomonas tetramitiformis TaxID=36881 RepID=A0AAE0C114_9CHLO|nr:hypothetical protein CYMTET_44944 [Cymbomonas tetramitiformis]
MGYQKGGVIWGRRLGKGVRLGKEEVRQQRWGEDQEGRGSGGSGSEKGEELRVRTGGGAKEGEGAQKRVEAEEVGGDLSKEVGSSLGKRGGLRKGGRALRKEEGVGGSGRARGQEEELIRYTQLAAPDPNHGAEYKMTVDLTVLFPKRAGRKNLWCKAMAGPDMANHSRQRRAGRVEGDGGVEVERLRTSPTQRERL